MLIELKDITKTYNHKSVLRDFSLTIAEGERLVLFGPSGCGKTTVLRLLAGFIAPDQGRILIGGELVAANGKNIKPPEGRNLGMVFQDLALWPHMSVRGNLEFGLKARRIPKREREARIQEMLALAQIERHASRRPAELSGGEQQRVALARALVLHPRALLMDEPLSSLDEDLNIRLRSEIVRLQEKLGFTLVYVTHNRAEAGDIATRTIRMQDGLILENVQ